MRVALTLHRPGDRPCDLVVDVEPRLSVGQLADVLELRDPARHGPARSDLTLAVLGADGRGSALPADAAVHEVGPRSGSSVALLPAASGVPATAGAPVALLEVVSGPDAGRRTVELPRGTFLVGRSPECDLRLSDPLVSKVHARVNVTDAVQLVDLNSSNGLLVGSEVVPRVVLGHRDVAVLGATGVRVQLLQRAAAPAAAGATVPLNRSPHLVPAPRAVKLAAPNVPQVPGRQPLPVLSLLAPVAMAGVLFAVTRSAASLLFVALSPLLMLASHLEGVWSTRRAGRAAAAAFRDALTQLTVRMQEALDDERGDRLAAHPSTAQAVEAVRDLTTLVWCRRPDRPGFLDVRVGVGTLPSRVEVEVQDRAEGAVEHLRQELLERVEAFSTIEGVPAVARLGEGGAFGIAGPAAAAVPVARGLLTQLLALHSPAELVVAAVASSTSAADWSWLAWAPHTASAHSPLAVSPLVTAGPSAVALAAALDELIAGRLAAAAGRQEAPTPRVLLLVLDDAPLDRSRLVDLAERGPAAGVHVVWVAPSVARLPAACRTFLDVDPVTGGAVLADVAAGTSTELRPEPLAAEQAETVARRLSPVVDAGARRDDQGDLPRSVSFLTLAAGAGSGRGPVRLDVQDVLDRWAETDRGAGAPERGLRALVGQAGGDPFYLDLRTQGPHALVGGTTGAGKSEFLQSWILGMASAHSPARVNFLFVDYKGGAAFKECVQLPHCVGIVTDLGPHLVRRALTSLRAELTRREHILNDHGVKDLAELEKQAPAAAPPSLVIVVDEFAALVQEVPEFVDGVVDVAQRGRSLGLHLILATQRPAGVIKDNLRANTNLRIGLRMADETDSVDVLGTPDAAAIDPAIPGRAYAKTGPGRVTCFQSAYASGTTPAEEPPPQVAVRELRFGEPAEWREPEAAAGHATSPVGKDLERLVEHARAAASVAQLPAPRRPWLEVLPAVLDLADVLRERHGDTLPIGLRDDPRAQSQPVCAYDPERGNMVVYGTGGSGKSAVLRTLAIAAGLTAGPCRVYGLDFGARGLAMLKDLPHADVVAGEDAERVAWLLRHLRGVVDERAERYAQSAAGTIDDYRRQTGRADEPRLLLLIDGVGTFRQGYELAQQSLWEMFLQVAADGRPVGVHVVVSADRPGAVPAALASSLQSRVVLRLADDNDYAVLGVPVDALEATSPPGRGLLGEDQVQVAVPAGSALVTDQTRETRALGAHLRRLGVPEIERVPRLAPVRLVELPAEVDGRPVVGVRGDTMGRLTIEPRGSFVVTGPPGSGVQDALEAIVQALYRSQRPSMVYLGPARSRLTGLGVWNDKATAPEDVDKLAENIASSLPGRFAPGSLVVVVEDLPLLAESSSFALQRLVKAMVAADQLVVAAGDVDGMSAYGDAQRAALAERTGVVLQPDQEHGLQLFKTPFPKLARAEFPPGRALHVTRGVVTRVQIASAD